MWLSGQGRARKEWEQEAQAGYATLGGAAPGVYLDGERREMALYAPGGYSWTPERGQEVLVLKNGGVGAPYCVAAARCDGSEAPGEVRIAASRGGAEIRLRTNGVIELNGQIRINGVDLAELLAGEEDT